MPPPGADRDVERVLGRRRAEQLAPARCGSGRSTSASRNTSPTGRSDSRSSASPLRWVPVSKRRMPSISSPNRSSRTGSGSPAGNRSMMPPRTRVLARLHHRAGAVVAIGLQEGGQRAPAAPAPPRFSSMRGAGEGLPRRHLLHQRVDRGEQDARPRARLQQPRQGRDPLGHDLRVGRDAVVGQAVPGREAQHLDVRARRSRAPPPAAPCGHRRGRHAAPARPSPPDAAPAAARRSPPARHGPRGRGQGAYPPCRSSPPQLLGHPGARFPAFQRHPLQHRRSHIGRRLAAARTASRPGRRPAVPAPPPARPARPRRSRRCGGRRSRRSSGRPPWCRDGWRGTAGGGGAGRVPAPSWGMSLGTAAGI